MLLLLLFERTTMMAATDSSFVLLDTISLRTSIELLVLFFLMGCSDRPLQWIDEIFRFVDEHTAARAVKFGGKRTPMTSPPDRKH
jgi:hypothetical protein